MQAKTLADASGISDNVEALLSLALAASYPSDLAECCLERYPRILQVCQRFTSICTPSTPAVFLMSVVVVASEASDWELIGCPKRVGAGGARVVFQGDE